MTLYLGVLYIWEYHYRLQATGTCRPRRPHLRACSYTNHHCVSEQGSLGRCSPCYECTGEKKKDRSQERHLLRQVFLNQLLQQDAPRLGDPNGERRRSVGRPLSVDNCVAGPGSMRIRAGTCVRAVASRQPGAQPTTRSLAPPSAYAKRASFPACAGLSARSSRRAERAAQTWALPACAACGSCSPPSRRSGSPQTQRLLPPAPRSVRCPAPDAPSIMSPSSRAQEESSGHDQHATHGSGANGTSRSRRPARGRRRKLPGQCRCRCAVCGPAARRSTTTVRAVRILSFSSRGGLRPRVRSRPAHSPAAGRSGPPA